jgi:hypothetical protein
MLSSKIDPGLPTCARAAVAKSGKLGRHHRQPCPMKAVRQARYLEQVSAKPVEYQNDMLARVQVDGLSCAGLRRVKFSRVQLSFIHAMKNARSWSPFSRFAAFGAAALVTTVAFGIRYLIHPWVEPYGAFQMFVFACIVSEYYFGLGPALLSLAMGGLLGTYYFVRPYQTFASMITRSDVIVTGNFVLVSVFVIVLIEILRRTLYTNQLLLKVSQSRHRVSLYRENDRMFLSRKSADTRARVEQLLSRFDRTLLLQLDDERYYPQALLYRLAPSLGSRTAKGTHWMEAFHPEDRPSLDSAFAGLRANSGTRPVISARIGEATDASLLVLERLEFEGALATVLRLQESTAGEPAAPGVAPAALTRATESPPRKPFPFRPGRIPK